MRKLSKTGLALIIVTTLLVMTVAAQSFYFIYVETTYEPSEYGWQQPWTVKQVVDFVEGTLTVTGSGYSEDPHDFELVIKSISPESDYALTAFDYEVVWMVDPDQETVTSGAYSGALLVGETVTYTGQFTPTLYGTGNLQLTINNIAWAQPEPITWTTEVVNTHSKESYMSVTNFEVVGATMSILETGTVSFEIGTTSDVQFIYKVEIVELGIKIVEGSDYVTGGFPNNYSFDFGPVTFGGSLTMRLTITNS